MACNHTRSEKKPYCVACDPIEEWLPIRDSIVRADERERIIKLIECDRYLYDMEREYVIRVIAYGDKSK